MQPLAVARLLGTVAAVGIAPSLYAQPSPRIPLIQGLSVVTAGQWRQGDFESIKQVMAIDEGGVRIRYSGRMPGSHGTDGRVDVVRRVRVTDARQARRLKISFSNDDDEVEPGATAIGASTFVLEELRHGRSVTFWVINELAEGSTNLLGAGIADADFKGTLARVEASPVAVPVLVRGERVMLSAIHARGRFGDGADARIGEFWFLDDADNPITLRMTFGSGNLEVVRIDYPATDTSRTIERSLAKGDTVVAYGLYFEFASDNIRPESRAVIEEIAAMMKKHPDWTLRVAGHTDSIGGTASNLDLSRRRALAVKTALVALGLPASHISTAGYGSSVPRESNATIQGRARNRRVELTRG